MTIAEKIVRGLSQDELITLMEQACGYSVHCSQCVLAKSCKYYEDKAKTLYGDWIEWLNSEAEESDE